jgi:hypothetical protein
MIPKWRYIRYTDDGSSEYQCLDCYNSWDARTAPGWFDIVEYVGAPCEGSLTISTNTGQRHFITRKCPQYKPTWTFCPYCGVKWEGPVRCDVDNEYMYGPNRLAVYNAVQARRCKDGWQSPEYTGLWWVIVESMTLGYRRIWEPKQCAKVSMVPAVKMFYLLRDFQARLHDECYDSHSCDHEAKIVVTYVQPKGTCELRNYEISQ